MKSKMVPSKTKRLSRELRSYAEKYETASFIEGDPSWFMHQASGKANQEVTAFIAACLGYRIEGVLDFSLIGILAKISTCLAENGIGIFAISTFNTDYILTKAENLLTPAKETIRRRWNLSPSLDSHAG